MTDTIYKAIVIGCGRIGCGFDDDPKRPNKIMTHAGAYSSHPRTKLVALVDIDQAKLKTYGEKYGVRTYADAKEAFAAEKPDIVSICTLMDTHLELVKQAVEAGVKMIWCEKPLTPTAREGKEMEALCASKGVVLINNFIKRFQPELHEVKKLVAQIQPTSITSTYTGGIWNNGIHAIDLLRFLIGEIKEANGATSKSPPRTPADPNLDGTLTFTNGLQAQFLALDETSEAVTSKGGLFRTTIEGKNGTLVLDHWNIWHEQNGQKKTLSVLGQQDYLRNAITNMIEAHESKTPLLCTGKDGWKGVEIVQALLDSAQNNKTITIGGQQ